MAQSLHIDARGRSSVAVRERPRQLEKQRPAGGPPPGDDDGDGGGRGGGGNGGRGGDDGASEPDGSPPPGSAELALKLALVAISCLFLIFLAVFVHLRRTAPEWPPPNSPPPPLGLWISTALLAASSACVARAGLRARRGERSALRRWLTATVLTGGAFLVVQGVVWWQLVRAGLVPSTNGYGALFYALTGLHALHVLAGLAYLALLRSRARRMRRAPPDPESVRLAGMYWHFMGLVWAAVFLCLWFPEAAA